MRRSVRQGGEARGSRRLRREEMAEGCCDKGSGARNQRRRRRQSRRQRGQCCRWRRYGKGGVRRYGSQNGSGEWSVRMS
ncbi:hypothetical protein IG631_02030 [Alternaria alternata]|nr:hypothetical protein IG631_02030 [Alternaria alternata]